jgi:hypothetical protein
MQILKITCIATFCLDFFSGLNDDTLLIPTKVKSNCQQERKQNRSSHELVSLTWSLWSTNSSFLNDGALYIQSNFGPSNSDGSNTMNGSN